MTQFELRTEFNKQYKQTTDKIHSLIAENLGIKKLYTQSNLWCEITDIDLRFNGQITLSASTFTYKLELDGHEMLEYRFRREVNNAPDYKKITKGNIESHSTDFRGLIETTNNLLKSIMSVKAQIIQEVEQYKNFTYQF